MQPIDPGSRALRRPERRTHRCEAGSGDQRPEYRGSARGWRECPHGRCAVRTHPGKFARGALQFDQRGRERAARLPDDALIDGRHDRSDHAAPGVDRPQHDGRARIAQYGNHERRGLCDGESVDRVPHGPVLVRTQRVVSVPQQLAAPVVQRHRMDAGGFESFAHLAADGGEIGERIVRAAEGCAVLHTLAGGGWSATCTGRRGLLM